jgi:hypothetical protein
MSESGYSNDELGFEWIQHFHKYTKDSVRGEWRLLIMDGHGSHMTKDFIDFCYEYKIHPFLLPAHSTHLLQPLDVGCFQPMKHHHQQLLEENIWYGGIDFDRSDFLACFQQISDRTFKAGTIRHAWQKTGLSPFWPRVVLDKLVEYNPPKKDDLLRLITMDLTSQIVRLQILDNSKYSRNSLILESTPQS